MNSLEKMESIVHSMLDASARMRARGWENLDSHSCPECGYEGRVSA